MNRRVFAIADLHLSFAAAKPMDVFGPAWADHAARVERHWRQSVGDDDIVLIAGDVSWAMRLEEAEADLSWLGALPGEKVLVMGNHDYWWQSVGKIRASAPPSLHFIQNDAFVLDGIAVGGTRLWDFPEVHWPSADPRPDQPEEMPAPSARAEVDHEKIRARECSRLENSLRRLPADASLRVAMVHYPPVGADGEATPLTDLIARHGVDLCVYGHLHALGDAPRPGADCRIDGVRYLLTSCDWLNCQPVRAYP